METTITVSNMSCNGCVNTISKKIKNIDGVEAVDVNLAENTVNIIHNEQVLYQQLTDALMAIGYPEATAENGLLTQLKSIQSCMTGKFSN